MGCSQSKAVAAPAPANNVSGGSTTVASTTAAAPAPSPSMKRSSSNHSFHSKSSRGRQREDVSVGAPIVASPVRKAKAPAKQMMNGTIASLPDQQWKLLWQTLPHPVDPADVPAVISDLMARQTSCYRRKLPCCKDVYVSCQNQHNKRRVAFA